MPRAIVIDDEVSIRSSLRGLLSAAGYSVQTYGQAGRFLRDGRPDEPCCLILDVRLPDMSSVEFQERLRIEGIDIPIVFVTGSNDLAACVQAMKWGAVDFLPKPVDPEQFLDAIHRAVERDAKNLSRTRELAGLRSRYDSLTPREREVFAAVTSGMLNKQVGLALGVTEATVKVHRARIVEKFGAESLAQLVRFADALGVELPAAAVAVAG